MSAKPTILIVGATGAQGSAVVEHLSSTDKYHILAMTRDTTSTRALALGKLPNVELVANAAEHGYDLDSFYEAAKRSDYAFINTDGFMLGEAAETYWGVRLFETAARAQIKHLIFSGLEPDLGKETNYDPQYYVGHFEGKARVQHWITAQPTSPMAWTIIRSGPYIEMLWEVLNPATAPDGTTRLFTLPIGDGAVPWQSLPDYGKYTDWILLNPNESVGKDIGIGIAHVSGPELAAAFTKVTGTPAKYVDVPAEAWTGQAFGNNKDKYPLGPDTKVGHSSTTDQGVLRMTYKENFTNWWNVYKASAGNKGLIRKDYEFLNRIVPDRVKSAEEWMRKVEWKGEKRGLLKSNDAAA